MLFSASFDCNITMKFALYWCLHWYLLAVSKKQKIST